MRHNHAQLYLNLAEVYQQSGRTQEAIEVWKRDWCPRDAISAFAGRWKKLVRAATDLEFPAPQPSGESRAGTMAPPIAGPSQAA